MIQARSESLDDVDEKVKQLVDGIQEAEEQLEEFLERLIQDEELINNNTNSINQNIQSLETLNDFKDEQETLNDSFVIANNPIFETDNIVLPNNVVVDLPTESGKLALMSDIPEIPDTSNLLSKTEAAQTYATITDVNTADGALRNDLGELSGYVSQNTNDISALGIRCSNIENNYLTTAAASTTYATKQEIPDTSNLVSKTSPEINSASISNTNNNTTLTMPSSSGTIALTSEIPDTTNFITTTTANNTYVSQSTPTLHTNSINNTYMGNTFTYNLPSANGDIALVQDVPDTNNFVLKASPQINSSNIINTVSNNLYSYTLPTQSGTIALTSDIPTYPITGITLHIYDLSSLLNNYGTGDTFFIKVYEGFNVAEITCTYGTNGSSTTLLTAGILYHNASNDLYIYGESYASNTTPYIRIPNAPNKTTLLNSGTSSSVEYSFHGYIYGYTSINISSNAVQIL